MHDHMGDYRPQGICDFSGFKVPADELVKNWDGKLVWYKFADRRNPQDFVRGVRDDMRNHNPSPEGADVFLATNEVTPESL